MLGMVKVSPEDDYLVQARYGPAFGIDEYSCSTKEEALDFAKSFCAEDPVLIQVVDRAGAIIYSHAQVMAAWLEYCKNHGIRFFQVEVALA